MFRKENGVTLVALVITIIVLLILAGVTISMVLGDDGIITNAQTATKNFSQSSAAETVGVACAELSTKYLADKYDGNTATTPAEVTAGTVATKATTLLAGDGEAVESGTGVKVTYTDGSSFFVPLTIANGVASVTGAASATN